MTVSRRHFRALLLALVIGAMGKAVLAQGAELVPANRAVEIFLSVCKSTVTNDFKDATKLMPRFGITRIAQTGTAYSESENLSMKIVDGPGFGKTCSIVFASKESASKVQAALPKLAKFKESPFGKFTVIEATGRLIMVVYQGTRSNGLMYHNFRMFSDRG